MGGKTVFWSWQSDRPGNVSRHFLKDVLADAIRAATEDLGLDESERPELDHDTKDEPGLVSIPESILAKIDRAAVFVGDLTPVAVSDEGRYVANPNVLLELGYAKKALGPSQIVLIWNSAWGGCSPDQLPFDLRHRRAPIRYELSGSSSDIDKRSERRRLIREVSAAISLCLRSATLPDEASPQGVQAFEHDKSIWFDPGAPLIVNAATSYGADRVSLIDSPRFYLRIIPSRWPLGSRLDGRAAMEGPELEPFGDHMGATGGPTRGGYIVYHSLRRDGREVCIDTATQWFADSGEIWGFGSDVAYTDPAGDLRVRVHYPLIRWARFLRRAEHFFELYLASGPFRIVGGITRLSGTKWSSTSVEALEEEAAISMLLPNLSATESRRALDALSSSARNAFGLSPSEDDLNLALEALDRSGP